MDIRKTFLDYFKKKDHIIFPSASLIPSDDPSVLLTTAGMQQFKPYYLGTRKPPHKRIASVQKCFRTSDIERVGYTDQHLTFFEMLGNFAFGDYFKKEAIDMAFDLIINILDIPLERISIGVFAGEEGIPEDLEAINLWMSHGIDQKKIFRFGKNENFWGPAGDTGPCGPCTEIYYDFGKAYACKNPDCSPSCDCERYLEIWNLVFTQYNFNGKTYEELPNKNIDTGMGLERIAAVLEGNPSVFKTSLFKPVVEKIEEISGKKLTSVKDKNFNHEINRCIKIVADHARAVTFLIADGVLPSNESRGYILRRMLRRAIRFGKLLDIKEDFLTQVCGAILEKYAEIYPELNIKKDLVHKIIEDEESRFSHTLKEGVKVLEQKVMELKSTGKMLLPPQDSFTLYDTFGFPIELTVEILKENGLKADIKGFENFLKSHIQKSKEKTFFNKKIDLNLEMYKEISRESQVEFTGYNEVKASNKISWILKPGKEGKLEMVAGLQKNQAGEIITPKTPFYSEKGGQKGDTGLIRTSKGTFRVEDTQSPLEGLIIHSGRMLEGEISTNEIAEMEVDSVIRKNISKNHTSTHILHWALRTTIGKEITQAGSFVSDERFRFDYHTSVAPTEETLEKVERIINEKIQKDDVVRIFDTTREYAQEIGAMSLFEEKYGRYVRVVEVDDYSRELCGGIHVGRTGEIGVLKIISDTGIGANIRRIEAVTGISAYNYLHQNQGILKKIYIEFDADSSSILEKIGAQASSLKKISEDLKIFKVKALKKEILTAFKESQLTKKMNFNLIDFNFTASDFNFELDARTMGLIGDEMLNNFGNKNTFLILTNILNDKPVMLLQSSPDLVREDMNCALLARVAGKVLKGGGGGRQEFAQVGGSESKELEKAIQLVKKTVMEYYKKDEDPGN